MKSQSLELPPGDEQSSLEGEQVVSCRAAAAQVHKLNKPGGKTTTEPETVNIEMLKLSN